MRCLERIGEIHRRKGYSPQALSAFEGALIIACQSGGKRLERIHTGPRASPLGGLGPSKTTTVLATSCEAERQVGFDEISSESLHGLASIKFAPESHGEAEEIFKESVGLARRTTQCFVIAKSLIGLAKIQRQRGELSEAVASLGQSFRTSGTVETNVYGIPLSLPESKRNKAIWRQLSSGTSKLQMSPAT